MPDGVANQHRTPPQTVFRSVLRSEIRHCGAVSAQRIDWGVYE